MPPPALLPDGCCAAVRRLLRSPTSDAARLPAFAPSQSRLVSSRSFLHARPALDPSAADHSPLQTDPECVRSLYQQRAQIRITLLADVHLRLTLSRVPSSRMQP